LGGLPVIKDDAGEVIESFPDHTHICDSEYEDGDTVQIFQPPVLVEGEPAISISGGSGGSQNTLILENLTVEGGASQQGGNIYCLNRTLVLKNVTLNGGVATQGGALYARNCTLDIDETTFQDGYATSQGGAIYTENSNGVISNGLIQDSEAIEGGGMFVRGGDLTVSGNELRDNLAKATEWTAEYSNKDSGGGAVFSRNGGDQKFMNNHITENHAVGNGGALFSLQNSPEWGGNLIEDNTCGNDGAGYFANRGGPWIHDNSFLNNKASDDAGGLRIYVGQNAVIEDNEFIGNECNDNGGGLKLSHSKNTIRRNLFQDNSAGGPGGGLALDNEWSDVTDCTFIDNYAGRGGGIHIWRNEADVTISNSTFVGNSTNTCGGGVQLDNNDHMVTFENVVFTENHSDNDGGAVCSEVHPFNDKLTVEEVLESPNKTKCGQYECPAEFEMFNAVFSDNSANDDGAGLYMRLGSATLENVVFYGNDASDEGSAVTVKEDGYVTLVNTIVSGNDDSPAIYLIPPSADDSYMASLSIDYSNIWGNEEGDFSGFDDPTGANGNISEDPLFTDPDNGDFTLQADSPCINSGTGQDSDGSAADMGAHGGPNAP
jgi:hypothetical protein